MKSQASIHQRKLQLLMLEIHKPRNISTIYRKSSTKPPGALCKNDFWVGGLLKGRAYFNVCIFVKGWHKKRHTFLNQLQEKVPKRLLRKRNLLVIIDFFITKAKVVFLLRFVSNQRMQGYHYQIGK